jgi:hypothetical protein
MPDLTINETIDLNVFRVSYKGRSRLIEIPEARWLVDDADQVEHCENVELPELTPYE